MVFLLMDARAYQNPTEANVLTEAQTLNEARSDRDSGAYGDGVAIVKADEVETDEGEAYTNFRLVE